MRVLVACEYSGRVREAFRLRGHDAWSCDLLEAEDGSKNHFQGDVMKVIEEGWDLMIAHPPCTYLSRAGARWWKQEGRAEKADAAEKFARMLYDAPIEMIAIENPIGQLNTRWRYPDQVVNPYEFGHPFSKATCLWLKNLPPLMATMLVGRATPFLPSNTGHGKRAGQKSHRGHVHNWKDSARTFEGIAEAMADQWGTQSPPAP